MKVPRAVNRQVQDLMSTTSPMLVVWDRATPSCMQGLPHQHPWLVQYLPDQCHGIAPLLSKYHHYIIISKIDIVVTAVIGVV